MSVVGVDFGTLNTVIAVARNRGVDVIYNEASNRATPTLVGFGPKSRFIGESAKTQEISNLKNTVSSLKRLAGRAINDPDVKIEQQYVSAALVGIGNTVGAEVSYLGKKEQFTATELIAMFLSKVKAIAAAELKLPVTDLVLSVPAWFTDAQRRSLMDAAEIAGLKLLRLMNDTTAAALGWGITKTDLPPPEEKPKRVAFIDIGHSNYTCSIVEFKKGELAVKSTACDRHFGGRDFDKALVDHFAVKILASKKLDITTKPKAIVRVAAAVEKLKKILSANLQAPLNIESLYEDIDVNEMLKREDFEALVEPLLKRATVPLEQALAEAKVTVDDIDTVEIIGGCTRVPALQERIRAFFKKERLSSTLNADEAVARGCAFSCAILSPVFRVRDFAIHDIVNYPIEFTWEKSPDIPDEDTALTVFAKGNVMPSTKILTFYRKDTFDLEAKYATDDLPGSTDKHIGKFSVKGVKADSKDDFMICKLKARLNLHGILNVEQGYYVEDVEVEEPIPEEKTDEKKDPDAMDTEPEKPKTRKVKKQVRKGDLPIVPGVSTALDLSAKQAAAEKEQSMIMEDKLVADTEEKKNELESYIYEMSEKIYDLYADFSSDAEKEKISAKLEAAKDWLYEEGDDTTKAVYVAKLEELRAAAGPIVQRYFDKVEEERQAAQAKADAETAAKREAEAAKKAASKEEKPAPPPKDTEMTDAEAVKTDEALD